MKRMTLERYQEVALTPDMPEYRLRKGAIVTLIEVVLHPHRLSAEANCCGVWD
jgi:hypothetical protein